MRLFNAVAKAQRARKEAEEGGAKGKDAARLSKASFLAELRGQQQRTSAPPAAQVCAWALCLRWLCYPWMKVASVTAACRAEIRWIPCMHASGMYLLHCLALAASGAASGCSSNAGWGAQHF